MKTNTLYVYKSYADKEPFRMGYSPDLIDITKPVDSIQYRDTSLVPNFFPYDASHRPPSVRIGYNKFTLKNDETTCERLREIKPEFSAAIGAIEEQIGELEDRIKKMLRMRYSILGRAYNEGVPATVADLVGFHEEAESIRRKQAGGMKKHEP